MGDESVFSPNALRVNTTASCSFSARNALGVARGLTPDRGPVVHSAPWRRCSRLRTRRAVSERRQPCTRSVLRSARTEARVLLVDLDPQACLTYSVGLDPEELPHSLHDVLVGRQKDG